MVITLRRKFRCIIIPYQLSGSKGQVITHWQWLMVASGAKCNSICILRENQKRHDQVYVQRDHFNTMHLRKK